jgi:hypothetical protein
MKRHLARYFDRWWLPALVQLCLVGGFAATAAVGWRPLLFVTDVLFVLAALAFLAVIAACIWNITQGRPGTAVMHLLLTFCCGAASFMAVAFASIAVAFGPSEDGFADNLTIPAGIEIADPEPEAPDPWGAETPGNVYGLQEAIRRALTVPGNNTAEFIPAMPSLRKASMNHPEAFRDYVEASPDWHVFLEGRTHFASRRWSSEGEPLDTLAGNASHSGGGLGFQTRCLLCLDRIQWSKDIVRHVQEGTEPAEPDLSLRHGLHKSRILIESGGVWVEIHEYSGNPERRVTKATLARLEMEFAEFLKDPDASVKAARSRSGDLASRQARRRAQPFRLLTGMQPGIYGVTYSLNPGEPGSVHLKAFEVTQGIPLSVKELEDRSKSRMKGSTNLQERFGAKAEFKIYEGDWGKPYAARFEVWFSPDSGKPSRKLAERVFKIEGWQR